MNNEQWVDIVYSPSHQISSHGRIRSVDTIRLVVGRWGGFNKRVRKGKILTPYFCGQYLAVRFTMGGKNHYIHRLVAEHFVDGDKTLYVNHIDGVKENNCAANLEFVTQSQNMLHSTHVLNKRNGQFGVGRIRVGC